MGNIDQRLQNVLSYLCEKEGVLPSNLRGSNSIRVWPQKSEEINKLRETISYLKNYTKIQTIAKSIASQESVKKDIAEVRGQLEEAIELTKKEIAELPKVPRKTKKQDDLYDFADGVERLEDDNIARAREERKNKLLELRGKIKAYKAKIRKLDSLERLLSNPKKLIGELFPEEEMQIQGEYSKLVGVCATAMSRDFKGRNLINANGNTNGIFNYDEKTKSYSINHKNARHFLSILKSKKEILEIANYANDNKAYNAADTEYKKCLNENGMYRRLKDVLGKKEFIAVADEINNIIEMNNQLISIEDKSYRKNIRVKIEKKIRKWFDMDSNIRIPKKIVNGRLQLAREIEVFLEHIKKNKKLEEAFQACTIGYGMVDGGYRLDYDFFKMYQHKLEGYGFGNVNLPTETIEPEEIKEYFNEKADNAEKRLYRIEKDRKNAKTQAERTADSLSPKAKKILNEEGLENVVDYAKKCYGFGKSEIEVRQHGIPASVAAFILESIMKRKNLPWNQMFEVYSDTIGDSREEETESLNETIKAETENMKERLAGLTQISTPEYVRE